MKKPQNSRAVRRKAQKKKRREKEKKKILLKKRTENRREEKGKREIWKIKREGEKEINRLIASVERVEQKQKDESAAE